MNGHRGRLITGLSCVLGLALLLGVARGEEDGPGHGPSRSLDGAWTLISAETLAPNGARIPWTTHESFLLISGGYYSMNWSAGARASDYYAERFKPTDDEKIARYGALLINAGRFEIDGGVLTIHPTFALVPEYVGGSGVFDYSLEGDDLELIWRVIESADGVPDPNTAVGVRFLTRWKRIGL